MPCVYLIQKGYFKDDVYKIGGSKNGCSLNSYGKGTKILISMDVNDYLRVKTKIKKSFNFKFTLIHGQDYFQGDEKEIKLEFLRSEEHTSELQSH